MRETGPVAKRVPQGGGSYLGLARTLLGQLKARMGDAPSGWWRRVLPDGTEIRVASLHGQKMLSIRPRGTGSGEEDIANVAFIPMHLTPAGEECPFAPWPSVWHKGCAESTWEVFGAPLQDEAGVDINFPLGTAYEAGIRPIDDAYEFREPNPNTSAWVCTVGGMGGFGAKRGQPANFGSQHWRGLNAFDIVSWDGPYSRYAYYSPVTSLFGGWQQCSGGSPALDGVNIIASTKVYHKLSVLLDLVEHVPAYTGLAGGVFVVGAGIHHTAAGESFLYVAVLEEPWRICNYTAPHELAIVKARIVRGDETYTRATGEIPMVVARYKTSDLERYTEHAPYPEITFGLMTGVYFNASGTKAVCTIGAQRLMAYDSALGHRDRRSVYLAHYDISNFTPFTDERIHAGFTTGAVGALQTVSFAADYVGDELVYLRADEQGFIQPGSWSASPAYNSLRVYSSDGKMSWTTSPGAMALLFVDMRYQAMVVAQPAGGGTEYVLVHGRGAVERTTLPALDPGIWSLSLTPSPGLGTGLDPQRDSACIIPPHIHNYTEAFRGWVFTTPELFCYSVAIGFPGDIRWCTWSQLGVIQDAAPRVLQREDTSYIMGVLSPV